MVKMENNKSAGVLKIHNVGFYSPTPRSINCFSFNETTNKLAVSRNDASIEIWDMRHAVYMEKCILGQPSASVEEICWLKNRLFSTGQTGELVEWNLQTLKPKNKVTLTGNNAWCMDANESSNCIAVGTEEGYVNIFNADDEDLNFVKFFDKQEGRILCCKYDASGNYIVTGSMDTIRIWSVAHGQAIYRMVTGRSEAKKETIVWSLVVLKNLTIIAGDSRGFITVWDGNNGTQTDSFVSLKADVLAVAVNSDETMFCCSGIDPVIRLYTQIHNETNGTCRWIPCLRRAVHDHDVKALTFFKEKIVSGGVDGYVSLSHSLKSKVFQLQKYGPFLPQPCAATAPSARLLLLKFFNYLELWRLGTPSDNFQLNEDELEVKKFLSLDTNLQKLVELRSKRDEPIVCASISPNGNFLIYSTETTVRLFLLDKENEKESLSIIKVVPDKFTPCRKVLFSSNSKSMYCIQDSGDINIFSMSNGVEIDFKETIATQKAIKDTINIACLSKCEKYLICAGTCCTVAIWVKNDKRWKYYTTLPKYDVPATAIAIHERSRNLVIAFSDYKIFEYDLSEHLSHVTCTTNQQFVKNLPGNMASSAITNILLDANNENIVILHNDMYLIVLEKAKSSEGEKAAKTNGISLDLDTYRLKKPIENYKHFVYSSWLSPSEIVAITVKPVTLIEELPPSLKQKKYGVS